MGHYLKGIFPTSNEYIIRVFKQDTGQLLRIKGLKYGEYISYTQVTG